MSRPSACWPGGKRDPDPSLSSGQARDELRRMAARRRLNLGSLEKEYVLDLVLRSLSAHETLRQVLVLKGSTALL